MTRPPLARRERDARLVAAQALERQADALWARIDDLTNDCARLRHEAWVLREDAEMDQEIAAAQREADKIVSIRGRRRG